MWSTSRRRRGALTSAARMSAQGYEIDRFTNDAWRLLIALGLKAI
jgi:hypothetical protein